MHVLDQIRNSIGYHLQRADLTLFCGCICHSHNNGHACKIINRSILARRHMLHSLTAKSLNTFQAASVLGCSQPTVSQDLGLASQLLQATDAALHREQAT